jgi:hypothetical protein
MTDHIAQAWEQLDESEQTELQRVLTGALLYYASPGTYFALSLFAPRGAQRRGDLLDDYGDEVSGSASTIKPGQLARAAIHHSLTQSARADGRTDEEVAELLDAVDFDKVLLEPSEGFYEIIGLDLEAREQRIRAKAEAEEQAEEQEREADPEFERFDCCGMSTEYAMAVPLVMRPHPEGEINRRTGEVQLVMPETCPRCSAPLSNPDPELLQPSNDDYLCGARVHSCGHAAYHNGTELCDYLLSLKKAS